ncbi:MAG: hypothetical protein FWG99_06295 [Treponema sp.]|nr:hypothetical protein [Treponema sp.]
MKIEKHFLLSIVVTALCISFSTCGDNDDPGSSPGGNDQTPASASSLYKKAPPVSASDTPVNLSGTSGATIVDKAVAYVNSNPGTYTLLLYEDIEIAQNTGRLLNQPNVNLTIIGIDAERKISLKYPGSIFGVGNASTEPTNITLTLADNITLVGYALNHLPAAAVTGGASLIMQGNAKITGNSNTAIGSSGLAGGVMVSGGLGDETTFIMKDNSVVSGNTAGVSGGGVYIDAYSIFTMQGNASVSGNTANYYGGGVYVYGSKTYGSGSFIMQGGTVSGNTAGAGGGVYAAGSFIMSGGTVYGRSEPAPLGNTATIGSALSLGASSSTLDIAQYGDGSDILPHTDNLTYSTNNTIMGK